MASIIEQPEVTISIANADLTVTNTAQKVLIIGQKLTAGTATENVIDTNIAATGAPENGLYGESSMLAAEIRAFRAINATVQIDAVSLEDGVGTPRVVAITIVGTATEAGTIIVVAGSETLHRFEVAIADTENETAVAASIVVAVNLDTKCPFTASNVAGVVSLTADNDGTVANDLGVETSGTIAGITGMAVSETTPGAVDPTLTTVFDTATDRYQGVVWPYAVNTARDTLLAYLDPRFNATNAILDGVGFVSIVDTHTLLLADGNEENSESLVIFGDKTESETNYLGPSQNEPSYSKSAMFAAVRALRLSTGASISRYLTSGASLDQFGGPATASLPYFNTPIPQLPVIKTGRGFTAAEIGTLFTAGVSVIGMNAGGTSALVGEVVTTYKTDSASNPDLTFKFLNYVDTSSNIREYNHNNLKARFAQSRLTLGPVSRGRDQANEVVIRAFLEKLYQDLSGPDFVLVQAGASSVTFFKENLTITLDLSLGKVTITERVLIVTQLRQIIMTIKVAFSEED